MFGILNKGEPDAEFSWQSQYKTPMLFVKGIAHEVTITRMADFDQIAKSVKDAQSIRAELEFVLSTMDAVRLVPVQ